MSLDEVTLVDISRQAIFILIKVSAPILLIALGVGLLISLFQALTQMQEATLSFVPKILTIFMALGFLMPYMIFNLQNLFNLVIQNIIG